MMATTRAIALKNRTLLRGRLQTNLLGTINALVPIASKPICFDVTNFASGVQPSTNDAYNPVYQYSGSAGTGSVGTLGVATQFDALSNQGGIAVNNPYWSSANADIPNAGNVFAVNRFFRFIIKGNFQLDNTRINIRFIQARQLLRVTGTSAAGYSSVILPDALKYMQHMLTVNMVNGKYFKTLYNKTLLINSHTYTTTASGATTGTTATTPNILHHTVAFNLNRPLKQIFTDPGATQTNGGAAQGWRWPNRPQAGYYAPIWCLISTDDVTSVNDAVNIQVESICRWRDPVGGGQ